VTSTPSLAAGRLVDCHFSTETRRRLHHYGVGLEATLAEARAPLTGVGLGLKVEFNVVTHSLGLDIHDNAGLGLTIDTSVSRPNVDLAAVVSF